jgi:hypothetical protein
MTGDELQKAQPMMAGAPDTKGRCCVFQPFDNGGAFDKRYDALSTLLSERQD